MTYFDTLGFVYRLVFSRFDLYVWVWSILAFTLSLLVVHWAWGRAWNAQWGLFRHPGPAITSTLLALVIATSALTWLAADRSGDWLEMQRTELSRQFADRGSSNRRVLLDTSERLGQVLGPDGNTLTLTNEKEVQVLAEVAAASLRCPLTTSGPLGPGAPCRVRDSASVAQEIVHAIPVASYPIKLSPDNPWIKAAVTAQVQEALSYAGPRLQAGMTELKTLMAWLFWIALGIQVLMVPISAVSDIRVHPAV